MEITPFAVFLISGSFGAFILAMLWACVFYQPKPVVKEDRQPIPMPEAHKSHKPGSEWLTCYDCYSIHVMSDLGKNAAAAGERLRKNILAATQPDLKIFDNPQMLDAVVKRLNQILSDHPNLFDMGKCVMSGAVLNMLFSGDSKQGLGTSRQYGIKPEDRYTDEFIATNIDPRGFDTFTK